MTPRMTGSQQLAEKSSTTCKLFHPEALPTPAVGVSLIPLHLVQPHIDPAGMPLRQQTCNVSRRMQFPITAGHRVKVSA